MQNNPLYSITHPDLREKHYGADVVPNFADGRFALDEDKGLVDIQSNQLYPFDVNIAKRHTAWENVPGVAKQVSYIFLKMLIAKPLGLPFAVLNDHTRCPKIHITRTDAEDNRITETALWLYPEGGIEDADHAGHYYAAGASQYRVDKLGNVHKKVGDQLQAVVPGTANRTVTLQLDNGLEIAVDIPRLVLLSFGQYTPISVHQTVIFKDGDGTNWRLSNLSLDYTRVDGVTTRMVPDISRLADPTVLAD